MDSNDLADGSADESSNSDRMDVGEQQSSPDPEDAAFMKRLTNWEKKALERCDDREACIGVLTARAGGTVYGHLRIVDRAVQKTRLAKADEQDPGELTAAIAANASLTRRFEGLLKFDESLQEKRREAERANLQTDFDPLRPTQPR